jgi:hypothetical protein
MKFKKGKYYKFNHPDYLNKLFLCKKVTKNNVFMQEKRLNYKPSYLYDLKASMDIETLSKYVELSSLEMELL